MIQFLTHVFETYSIKALGYWPKAFEFNYKEETILGMLIMMALNTIICAGVWVFYGYKNKAVFRVYFVEALKYLSLNASINFLIHFITFNFFGWLGMIIFGGIWYFSLFINGVMNIEESDDEIQGIFWIQGYMRDRADKKSKFHKKIIAWKAKYKETLNTY